jgi:hypothetical protein
MPTNRIKTIPSGEVIICSGYLATYCKNNLFLASANKAVLVDVRDHQIATTLPSIPNTFIGNVLKNTSNGKKVIFFHILCL